MAASTDTVSFFLPMAVVAMAVLQATAASSPPPPPKIPDVRAPKSCSETFYELNNCVPFLTFGTVISIPPANCCAALKEVLGKPASICLCHLLFGGEINEYLGINVDPIRLALLPVACLAIVPPELPAMCFIGPVPPISTIVVPPMAPSPPVTPPSPMPPTPPLTPPSPSIRPLP